jgi:glucose/arabinose dehydrogenase
VTLATGFGGITDVETGPDGYLYILTFAGELYRVVPAADS